MSDIKKLNSKVDRVQNRSKAPHTVLRALFTAEAKRASVEAEIERIELQKGR